MPDILIRGMEMPKTCFGCPFFVVFYAKKTGICTAFGDGTNREKMSDRMKETGRMSGCPLHELPEHGDLIDRDAFIDLLPCGDIEHDEKIWRTAAIADAIFLAQKTPVIVPSNKEETVV